MKLSIYHRLSYRYAQPIQLGPQRLQLYPRLSHRQRLLAYDLTITPPPVSRHTHLDIEGNTTLWVYFQHPTDALQIDLRLQVESRAYNPFDFILFPFEATRLPLVYQAPEDRLLAPYRLAGDIPKEVADWTGSLLEETDHQTVPFLIKLSEALRHDFTYIIREEGPPFPPAETMAARRGSCRDLSLLMIAACQSAGIAGRFVSGYAWAGDALPSHELHAWVEVYLPGAGWCAFDPTMGGVATESHVALAASADPALVAPLRGIYWGEAHAKLETEVTVDMEDG